jgi:cytochrome c biogenesis protein CcmG/thiol:disulfide interchange protein DsbE
LARKRTTPKGRPTPGRRDRRRDSLERSRRRRLMVVAFGALAAVFVAAILVVAVQAGDRGGGSGTTDAESFNLPALDGGGRVRLADFRGRPLVVNFFASWCTQCDAELPEFRDTARRVKGQVDFVFVNSNEDGDWRPMAERNDILDFTLAEDVGGTRGNGLYRSVGGPGGMPITAFYDAQGKLVDVAFGALLGGALDDQLQELYGVAPA